MKIAITGSHGTGKTTLAEELQEKLPGYELYAEPYYALEESGYLFQETPDTEDFIRQFQFSVKQMERSGDNAIFDRCPIDLLAYIHSTASNRNIESFFETAQQVMKEIDLLVFVRIENPDRITLTKSELLWLRENVNDLLVDWINDFGIPAITVTGSPAERCNQVFTAITG